MENNSEIILYQTENGQTKLEVRLENETVWLSNVQKLHIANSAFFINAKK